ncbi:hypothetical protein FOVG_18206 [Fusarium oxysporum f. sp. pisi HDV247]|uniref:Uncharacterized protein n=1 Tax=Fusarium oxysporum f. sp. pisi HDV247 TaxID=1080344 RepID=W9NRH4_FUSOX|nr:hypothetical protein FOVG_18206 [Fusarium oxysporum f. sp. pisi HDV247]
MAVGEVINILKEALFIRHGRELLRPNSSGSGVQ